VQLGDWACEARSGSHVVCDSVLRSVEEIGQGPSKGANTGKKRVDILGVGRHAPRGYSGHVGSAHAGPTCYLHPTADLEPGAYCRSGIMCRWLSPALAAFGCAAPWAWGKKRTTALGSTEWAAQLVRAGRAATGGRRRRLCALPCCAYPPPPPTPHPPPKKKKKKKAGAS
jgi:hypothetical protein